MYQLYTHCFERGESVWINEATPAYTRNELIKLYNLRPVEDLSLPLVKHKYRLITDPKLHKKMKDDWLAHYTILDADGEMNDKRYDY